MGYVNELRTDIIRDVIVFDTKLKYCWPKQILAGFRLLSKDVVISIWMETTKTET